MKLVKEILSSRFLSHRLDSPGVLEVMEEGRLCGDDCSCLSETFGTVLIFGSDAFSYLLEQIF